MPSSGPSRVVYLDWMRGLACLLMFQTHCYDSWLSPAARNTSFFRWSQAVGGLPAPLFLFLTGISLALVISKLRAKGLSANQIGRAALKRGGVVFAIALLFRLQQYAVAFRWAPWTDLFRVDILNTIAVSMLLMAVLAWIVLARGGGAGSLVFSSLGVALVISLLAPLVFTFRPQWLPWEIESYLNGVHDLGVPQRWLFPIFPWAGFAFAGFAMGFVLFGDRVKTTGAKLVGAAMTVGAALIAMSWGLDSLPWRIYPVYNFWRTSPNFFWIRVGALLIILSLVYSWCRWGAGEWGFSPLAQMGKTSLLVYWVHIEFVYGRVSILPKRLQSIGMASLGLAAIFVAMVLLSMLRTWWKGRGTSFNVSAIPRATASTGVEGGGVC